MKVPILLFFAFLPICSFAQVDSTQNLRADSLAVSDTVIPASVTKTYEPMYKLKPAVDIPITAVGTGWSLYAFTVIYSKDASTKEQILALNKEDINSFDRPGADVYNLAAKDASDYLFYGAMPLPILLLTGKHMRKDAAKWGFLYLEAMSITGLLYTSATYFTNRYRPLAYNPEVPMETRMRGGAKNSFYAGHVALVATSVFFTSKVYADYHPHSPWRWVFFGGATAVTITQGYLRYQGGQHFRTDIILGSIMGTASGLLVPHFHKMKKPGTDSKVTILPFAPGGTGLTVLYKL